MTKIGKKAAQDFSLGEERPMMGLSDDSFELLKTCR
jgi:hypothetical protein